MNSHETHETARRRKRSVVRSLFREFRVFVFFVVMLMLAAAVADAQPSFPTAIPQTKFDSGQDIQPYFEGWIRNGDGTFDMVFGYFNRNWKEELAVAAGARNSVEPGGPDRGQPTYFLPRRQGWVYRVRVPANFGKQTVTWTVTANGKTNKAYGELDPVEEITERIIQTRGNLNPGDDDPNKPPTIAVTPLSNVSAGAPIQLVARVTDDGLPKPRVTVQRTAADATKIQAQANSAAPQRPRGLNVTWMQLRGPAKVAFDAAGPVPVSAGNATVNATFTKPGTYTIRATANDGALSVREDVTVDVTVGSSTAPAPLIENNRVTVWDVSTPQGMPNPPNASVWVAIAPNPTAVFVPQGGSPPHTGAGAPSRAIVIDLKPGASPKYAHDAKFPNAFPRPGAKKILENDRVIVWDYTWTPNEPTPMHFHDKDVVVVFLQEGALKSTTPDGQSTTNELTPGKAQFNRGDRVHSEVLVKGASRAIITELK